MTTIDAIIVGAGSGARLGYATPKAFVDLCGKQILHYSLTTFVSHPSIRQTILVVSGDMVDDARMIINKYDDFKDRVMITTGGDERWKSVQNGVLSSNSEWVLIHDAARPFVTHKVIDSVLDMRERFDCVITATPEVDTIRMIKDDERCGVTVDRSKLLRVGTPQLFRRELLISSFNQIKNMVSPPTDEAALFESLGIEIGYSLGDPLNFKITTKTDLEIATSIIAGKAPVVVACDLCKYNEIHYD
jgi:2-C-methyl-D-erythritol 4-phosphate cytidylyltransferase